MMKFGDTSRLGVPYSKDPTVVAWQNRYLLYFSLPPYRPDLLPPGGGPKGWSIGVAESHDLTHWQKIGEILPELGGVEENGICAPGARVLDGKIHLFYQTYGNGARDALCHAVSGDGVYFERDPSNPVFSPKGAWSVGRAIDAEVFEHEGRLFLYYATRDPDMKIQMLGVAACDRNSDFGRNAWEDLSTDCPLLKPELAWENKCVEAPAVCKHDNKLFMFYGGAYNNAPQQIGLAVSDDAVHWTRAGDAPFLPSGGPNDWNASESGHPAVFRNETSGETTLFYQGNNDNGKTWFLSQISIRWENGLPVRGDL